ncbi:response regulator [Dyella solisilvae]|uniref:Sensory/regulatory protein RpfC n=1 Tax=Dyella solisilvae TaxID=1920168 RepID=A0A370KAM1_9GAMM|nr:transporter substrate-binding domain-containing protein [Dyella solisilvae]RDI99696.1 response regulator [Dyella solisilvae]
MDASMDNRVDLHGFMTIDVTTNRFWTRPWLVFGFILALATGPCGWARTAPLRGDAPHGDSGQVADVTLPPTLQLTPDEAAWRSAHPKLDVGVFAGDHLPAESWVAGRPEGFAVDYARLLAGRLGLQLVFHPFTDLDAVLAAPETDAGGHYELLLAVSQTREHAARFEFLKPYGGGRLFLVARKGDETMRSEQDLVDSRIVIERSFHHVIRQLAERFPDARLLYADDGQQAMDMVATGQADAYVGTTASRTRMLLQGRRSDDLVALGPLDLPPVAVGLAVPRDQPMLLQLLRKAEASLDSAELVRLRSRWGLLEGDNMQSPVREPSTADRMWLGELPPLRLGYEADRPPYSFADAHGQFAGLAADYMELVQKELGLRVQLVPAKDWRSLQQMVRAGEVDLVAAAMPDDFSAKDMLFSRTYEHFPEVIVARTAGPVFAGPEDLAGHVVATRDEAGLAPRLAMLLPHSELLPVGSNEEGLAAVASHRADAYIGTLPAIDPLIRDRYAATLRVVGPAGVDQDFTVAVASRYQHLMPMIDRVLTQVSAGQRQAIRSRWLTTQYRYGVPWSWVFAGLGAAVLILGAIGFSYFRLRGALRAQRGAERQLDAQLRFQQALLETVPYPVFVKDAKGRYLAVNQAYEAMFDCRREDLLGRTLAQTRHIEGADADALHQADLDLLAHGQDVRRELRLGGVSGKIGARDVLLWLHGFKASPDTDGSLFGTVVDVTDLRQAEARALASEQLVVETNESLPGVVMRARYRPDGASSYDHVSGPTEALFGLTNEDLLQGRHRPFDHMPAEDMEIVRQAIRDLREGSGVRSAEFRAQTPGGLRWIRASFGLPRIEDDGTMSCSIFSMDVSAEKAQAQALVEAKSAAEAAVAAKSAFLAMMSHEIRTPMAGVLGLIELLGKTPLDREQQHMLDLVHDSAGALLQILNDVLDFSRIEAGRLRLDEQVFDLRALVDAALGLHAAQAQEKGLRLYGTLDWRLAGGYRGDVTRVRQVITNLLSNALKFTEKGYVELHVELMGETPAGQRLRFTVSDTGVGISAEQLERLFQPFVQADDTTSRRYGGTGLGLSICRHLARLMGGEIRLGSAPGFGTQAVFELPLPVEQALRPQPALVGKRALLCTRDIMLERELSNALSALGLSVMGADAKDLGDFAVCDADVFVLDQDLAGEGWQPGEARVINLSGAPDPRGFYIDDGEVMLSGYPLLWRSAQEACHAVFGLAMPGRERNIAGETARHGERILVAEDHPINRAVIARQLDRLGYPHTIVDNGEEAMRALAGAHYDLLITDCHMPVLDGYALARRIRAQEEGSARHLPIVALSASALPEEVVRCREAGMDEFLAKPVQLAALDRMLSSCLTVARGAVDADDADVDGGDRLNALFELFGSKPRVLAILRELATHTQANLADLDAAFEAGNQTRQREILHHIEGALRVLGGTMLADNAEPGPRRDELVRQLRSLEAWIAKLESESEQGMPGIA